MHRRTFVKAVIGAAIAPKVAFDLQGQVSESAWRDTWTAALATLAANVRTLPRLSAPVLQEGTAYRGTWLECGPHESLAYSELSDYVVPVDGKPSPAEISKNTHQAFFNLQRADGQLPASVKLSGMNWGQVQMVVPIAATAWELASRTRDEALLDQAYMSCSRWDAWLRQFRDTRGTGLVEAFCTYDTGQDDSPRWAGVANECPGHDAKRFVPGQGVPRLCPDLSATVFGARVALYEMARALGKRDEAERWLADSEHIRSLIVEKLWSEEDSSFYDVDSSGAFVRVRSVANMRVLGEHVLRLDVPREKKIFDRMWKAQLHRTGAYWTRFPFPSIAADDPKFVRPIPRNSWGGAAQALTALRTLRWMEHYGKGADQRALMNAWTAAIVKSGGFFQQMDPDTGVFTQPDPGGYSPCALVFLHFAKRLGRAPRATQAATAASVAR